MKFKNNLQDLIYSTEHWDYMDFIEDTLITHNYVNDNRTTYTLTQTPAQMFMNYLMQIEEVLGDPSNTN